MSIHIPNHVAMLIETERLLLPPMQPGHLDSLVTLHSQPEVTRFMSSLDRWGAQASAD